MSTSATSSATPKPPAANELEASRAPQRRTTLIEFGFLVLAAIAVVVWVTFLIWLATRA